MNLQNIYNVAISLIANYFQTIIIYSKILFQKTFFIITCTGVKLDNLNSIGLFFMYVLTSFWQFYNRLFIITFNFIMQLAVQLLAITRPIIGDMLFLTISGLIFGLMCSAIYLSQFYLILKIRKFLSYFIVYFSVVFLGSLLVQETNILKFLSLNISSADQQQRKIWRLESELDYFIKSTIEKSCTDQIKTDQEKKDQK